MAMVSVLAPLRLGPASVTQRSIRSCQAGGNLAKGMPASGMLGCCEYWR